MKPETASIQRVTVDYGGKMKRNGPLGRDVNQHPSVDDQLPVGNTGCFLTSAHTRTQTYNERNQIFHFSLPGKLLPLGSTTSNFHLPGYIYHPASLSITTPVPFKLPIYPTQKARTLRLHLVPFNL
ncbi:hypothetical protein CHARACLAT_012120 [Characodon lateralis]|uniref:Uncharacterized protein n=1 Tax=Characodon lateralis TaxID=208331 RepID=A0ABU7D652_9TELE|nr:hypothetical protein [Characodon lateralis]